MRPPDHELRLLLSEWVRKADLDFRTVLRLSDDSEFREVIAFHAQQAVEKYIKALLTIRRIEFPKTHDIHRLLELLGLIDPALAADLEKSAWLTPFGVQIRYPADRPETLPGDEHRARQLAEHVRTRVMAILEPYLAEPTS
jgi:HEPN domain-containing protein